MTCHRKWSHNPFQKGDLGPQNALTETTSSFPVVICSVAPLCLAGWVPQNTLILLISMWFHREGPGGGNPSSATCKTPPDPMMGCPPRRRQWDTSLPRSSLLSSYSGFCSFGGAVVTPHEEGGGGPADNWAAAQHRAHDDAFALHPKGFRCCAKLGPALFSTYNATIALP